MSILIASSILACDFLRLADEVKKAEGAGADLIHIDVMDGHFVPNITVGPDIVKAIRLITNLPIESHLMIDNPDKYIHPFIKAGSDIVTVHSELYIYKRRFNERAARRSIDSIRDAGARAGIALNPATPLCIQGLLNDVDMVLIMSVNPGFAGQKFIPEVLPKIKNLRKIFNKDIAVDGGINAQTARETVKAGANILVAGSYFYNSKNPLKVVQRLKRLKNF